MAYGTHRFNAAFTGALQLIELNQSNSSYWYLVKRNSSLFSLNGNLYTNSSRNMNRWLTRTFSLCRNGVLHSGIKKTLMLYVSKLNKKIWLN